MAYRTCICGCGREFWVDDEDSRPGRPRLYYEPACRKRAQRRRDEAHEWIRPAELHIPIESPVKQVASAVVETAGLAGAFKSMAVSETDAPIAAACECMAIGIIDLLDKHFPGWQS